MTDSEIAAALATALEAEKQSLRTYLKLAWDTRDGSGKQMFIRLATDELEHMRVLEAWQVDSRPPGAIEPSVTERLVPRLSDKSLQIRGTSGQHQSAALNTALYLERLAQIFYEEHAHSATPIVADAHEELPLWEVTHPADISEIHQAIPLLRETQGTFSLSITTVSADAAYDAENNLCFIMEDLNAQAIIPRNRRGERTAPHSLKGNSVLCPAELPMHRRGKMTVKKAGITYLQYSCPLHYGKERQRHLLCPVATSQVHHTERVQRFDSINPKHP